MVETDELESSTPCMSSMYSNQLSYASVLNRFITCPILHIDFTKMLLKTMKLEGDYIIAYLKENINSI